MCGESCRLAAVACAGIAAVRWPLASPHTDTLPHRLFTSIIRYDPVYVVAFKTNYGLVRHDYPYLHHWLKKMYWTVPACKDTTHWDRKCCS